VALFEGRLFGEGAISFVGARLRSGAGGARTVRRVSGFRIVVVGAAESFRIEVSGAPRGAAEDHVFASFEDTVEDHLGEIAIVEDLAPVAELFVGREDHGFPSEVAVVDDAEQDVRGVGRVVEVADFVDDQDVWLEPDLSGLAEPAITRGGDEIVDQPAGANEARGESVLDGAVADGAGEVCLSAAGSAREDEVASFADELGPELGAELLSAEAGLEDEVEVLDGLDEREAGQTCGLLDASVVSVRDLFGHEECEEVTMRPALRGGASRVVRVQAPDSRHV
jgi:hypothetical protein